MKSKIYEINENNFIGSIATMPNKDEYLVLLEKKRIIDIKLSKMFLNYIKSKHIENTVNIKDLIIDLNAYYASYVNINDICFAIESDLKEVDLEIEKEGLYIIIFSLVNIKLRLLMNGDNLNIKINIQDSKLVILMSDSGFLLNSNKINEYSNNFNNNLNVFLLSWKETMSLLSEYDYEMNIVKNNLFKIEFALVNNGENIIS